MKITPVILSGGAGTRLWPLSRQHFPKQLLPLHGEASMLQATLARVGDPARYNAPIIVANEDHRFIIADQLDEIGVTPQAIILEPTARNTAPAIALAALAAADDALLLVLPSDHVIADTPAFDAAVATAADAAADGRLVTFGITASRPETGYGYIRMGEALGPARAVAAFVEKPDLETARSYVESGAYVWNSGMFLFPAKDFLAELGRFEPEILAACRTAFASATRDGAFLRPEAAAFAASPSKSIDYAVMERTERAACVPADLGWSDVGAWSALWDLGAKDADGNVRQGDTLVKDAQRCYLRSSGPTIACVGLDDVVVVATPDAILVAHRDRVQDVKAIVEQLAKSGRDEHLFHTMVHRPWGTYEITDRGEGYQTKRVVVKPGERLALAKHQNRAEHWIIVRGIARVTRGDATFVLGENESIYVPADTPHKLENIGASPLHLIEVQSGRLLSEDDVVRFESR